MASIIVVGSGLVGLSSAVALAEDGHKVSVVDQNNSHHDWNGSAGATRMLRTVYTEDPEYVPLAVEALRQWRVLEKEANETIYLETGVLEWGAPTGPLMSGTFEALKKHPLPVKVFSVKEARAAYPMFAFRDDVVAVHDSAAGVLRASRILALLRAKAERLGVQFYYGREVEAVEPTSGRVTVKLRGSAAIEAEACVLATGGWSQKLLPFEGGRKTSIVRKVMWERDEKETSAFHVASGCPSFAFELAGADARMMYGFPQTELTPMKVAEHTGMNTATSVQTVDRTAQASDEKELKTLAHGGMPSLQLEKGKLSVCFYDQTEDGHFVVGAHPDHANVFLASGTSGHGFKFGPIFGELAVAWVRGKKSPYALRCFVVR